MPIFRNHTLNAMYHNKISAFSKHRLSKKQEGGHFEIAGQLVLSPFKYTLFTFIHILNRTIGNVAPAFWFNLIISILHLAMCVISPYNVSYWTSMTNCTGVARVFMLILRFVPLDAPDFVMYIMFAIYCLIILLHFLSFVVAFHQIQIHKPNKYFMNLIFVSSFIINPIIKGSMTSILCNIMTFMFINPSFGNFFLLLIAVFFLLMLLFNCCYAMLAMSSAPNPNTSNPVAAWAPDAICSAYFEIFMIISYALQEFLKNVPKFAYSVFLFFYALALILFFIYIYRLHYLLSFNALEFFYGIYLACPIFYIYLGIFGVIDGNIPLAALIVPWATLPIIMFFMVRGFFGHQVHKTLAILDSCGAPTEMYDDTRDENTPLLSSPNLAQIFQPLVLKNSRSAINVARIACFCNHPLYEDMSIINYLIEQYPKYQFQFIHLAYLMPSQYEFVNRQIEEYLKNYKPNFLIQCILFQMVSGIMESSNDIPPTIRREINQQAIQSMKCQQYLTKYWTTCYKGDITQMAKHAFLLYKCIHQIDESWKTLVHRYPFSNPILKEYLIYLQTTGTQHKLAEAILHHRPNLADISNHSEMHEGKTDLLNISIEGAVDRRPIYSLAKVRFAFAISIIIALVFLVLGVATGFNAFILLQSGTTAIYNADMCNGLMTHIPNMHDDLKNANPETEYETRNIMYYVTTLIYNQFNNFIRVIPEKVFQDSEQIIRPFFFKLLNYTENNETSAYAAMLQITYFSHALAFSSTNDPIVELVTSNVINTFMSMDEFSRMTIYSLEQEIDDMITIEPYFYIACWVIILLFMIPSLYISLSSLKQEITYLFSLYLTIPRSTINKLIEIGNQMRADRRQTDILSTTSFMHTTKQFSTADEKQEEDENIADGFKMLASDSTSENFSVFPPNFILKCCLLIFSITAIIGVLACFSFFVFTLYSQNTIQCLYTLHLSSYRMMISSILMHGISSIDDYSYSMVNEYLNQLISINSALLYATDGFNLSNDVISNPSYQAAQFTQNCEDSSNYSCKSMADTFNVFLNEVANATSLIGNGQADQVDANFIRNIYNGYLALDLINLNSIIYDYTQNQLQTAIIIDIVFLIVPIVLLIIVIIFAVIPIMKELNSMVHAVKLPLKHIDPYDLADLPKLMQYLQGECDWGRGYQGDKSGDEQGGNSVLNAMLCPFAIFEEDLTLLFANSAFYSMLGTTKEATVGLQMEEIFSPIMGFQFNENHPFNFLLETVQQLRRGVSPVKSVEINTEIDSENQGSTIPVMIRLVGLTGDDPSDHDNKGHDENDKDAESSNEKNESYAYGEQQSDRTNHNLKATQYVVFINDLTQKIKLDKKLKYETEVSQKLLDGAIPKALASILRNGNTYEIKHYQEIPLLMFILRFPAEEDGDDDLLIACSQFLRSSQDMAHTFSSITRLTHTPPTWIYTAGMNMVDQNDFTFNTGELANFALSIIDVFNNSASTTCTLSALIHIGEITLLPLNTHLPHIQLHGPAYKTLNSSLHLLNGNTLFATEEAQEVLQNIPDVNETLYGNLKDATGKMHQYYTIKRSTEITGSQME